MLTIRKRHLLCDQGEMWSTSSLIDGQWDAKDRQVEVSSIIAVSLSSSSLINGRWVTNGNSRQEYSLLMICSNNKRDEQRRRGGEVRSWCDDQSRRERRTPVAWSRPSLFLPEWWPPQPGRNPARQEDDPVVWLVVDVVWEAWWTMVEGCPSCEMCCFGIKASQELCEEGWMLDFLLSFGQTFWAVLRDQQSSFDVSEWIEVDFLFI